MQIDETSLLRTLQNCSNCIKSLKAYTLRAFCTLAFGPFHFHTIERYIRISTFNNTTWLYVNLFSTTLTLTWHLFSTIIAEATKNTSKLSVAGRCIPPVPFNSQTQWLRGCDLAPGKHSEVVSSWLKYCFNELKILNRNVAYCRYNEHLNSGQRKQTAFKTRCG